MAVLATLGTVLVFLGVLGSFLDKHHFDEKTITKVRLALIACYVHLYDIPKRTGPIVRWWDKVHERRPIDIRTGEYLKEPNESRYGIILLLQVLIAITFPIIHLNCFNGFSWLASIAGGIVLAYMAPLLVMIFVGAWAVLFILAGLFVLATTEAIRRFLLSVLNKSTSPQTSPFTYLAALVSVFTAGGVAANQLAERWEWQWEKPAFIVWIERSIDPDPFRYPELSRPGYPSQGATNYDRAEHDDRKWRRRMKELHGREPP